MTDWIDKVKEGRKEGRKGNLEVNQSTGAGGLAGWLIDDAWAPDLT